MNLLFSIIIFILIIISNIVSRIIERNTRIGKMNKLVLESITKLSLMLMKVDNTISHSELYAFRDFMLHNFGNVIASAAIDMLQEFKDKPQTVAKAAKNINSKINYTERMHLMRFFMQLAASDGEIEVSEWTILEQIARQMQIEQDDFTQLKNMYEFYYKRQYNHSYSSGGQNYSYTSRQTRANETDYAMLGIKSSDSNETIKAAYRRLAIANHPDKVQHLGETARKEAEKRFSEINQAYDRIKKAREI